MLWVSIEEGIHQRRWLSGQALHGADRAAFQSLSSADPRCQGAVSGGDAGDDAGGRSASAGRPLKRAREPLEDWGMQPETGRTSMNRFKTFALATLAASPRPLPSRDRTTMCGCAWNWMYYGSHAGSALGKDKGFYWEQGINLDIRSGNGSGSAHRLVANGDSDFPTAPVARW